MPTKRKTIYLFEGAAYDWTEMNGHLEEVVMERYPEIVHSDFIADESGEFEDLWEDVEEIEYIYWELKNFIKTEVKEVVENFAAIQAERELEVEDYHDFVNSIKEIYNRRIKTDEE